MVPLFASRWRRAGSCLKAAGLIFVVSLSVGTAAAQELPDTPRMAPPQREPDMEQIRQLFEDSLRNAPRGSNVPRPFAAKKAVRELESGANGVLAALIVAVGSIGLLVGFYLLRRMAVKGHGRRGTLDDPRVRAYLLSLEGGGARDRAPSAEIGIQKTRIGS